jgi:16S rRNA (uracil1498-N3)-methyltransferase
MVGSTGREGGVKAAATVVVEPEVLAGATLELSGDAYHHLFRARRLAGGESLRVVDGAGNARWGRITGVGPDRATIELGATAPVNEPAINVELWVAPPRSRRAAWMVEKATELGVGAIHFVLADRAARELPPQALERLRRVAVSAVEQCHRARVPGISGPHTWEACLERLDTSSSRVLVPGGGVLTPAPSASSISLLVGPEGGWSASELSQLSDLGVASVGLGPRVLRVETAAVVAAALALATS